jgi:hypothetical protein
MAKTRIRIFNPHGKKRRGTKAKKAKRNPLSELIFMNNPRGGKERKHHVNKFHSRKRRNRSRSRARIFSRSRHHRRNPSRQSSEGFKGDRAGRRRSACPPLLADFFDPDLCMDLPQRKRRIVLRVDLKTLQWFRNFEDSG